MLSISFTKEAYPISLGLRDGNRGTHTHQNPLVTGVHISRTADGGGACVLETGLRNSNDAWPQPA